MLRNPEILWFKKTKKKENILETNTADGVKLERETWKNSHSKNPWNNPPIIHISPTLGQLFTLPQLCFTARAEKQLSRCIPSRQTTSDEANRHPGFICTSIRPHNSGSDQLPLLWLVHFLQCHLFSIPLHCECQKYVLQSTSAVTENASFTQASYFSSSMRRHEHNIFCVYFHWVWQNPVSKSEAEVFSPFSSRSPV